MKSTRICLLALAATASVFLMIISAPAKPKQLPAKLKKEEITRWEGEGGSI